MIAPGAFVDPTCPTNWAHPFNRALVGRWKVVPNAGWSRGATLRDLARSARQQRDGTLTNGVTWAGPPGKPSSPGILSFASASSQYVQLPTFVGTPTQAGYTICAWINPTTLASYKAIVQSRQAAGSRSLILSGGAGNPITYEWNDSTVSYNLASGLTVTTGTWNFAAVSINSVDARLYRGTAAGVWGTYTNTAETPESHHINNSWRIGADPNNANYWNGQIDDVRIWSRAISETEIYSIFAESLIGSPESLNWVSTRSWSIPVAASGTAKPLFYHQRQMQGMAA